MKFHWIAFLKETAVSGFNTDAPNFDCLCLIPREYKLSLYEKECLFLRLNDTK